MIVAFFLEFVNFDAASVLFFTHEALLLSNCILLCFLNAFHFVKVHEFIPSGKYITSCLFTLSSLLDVFTCVTCNAEASFSIKDYKLRNALNFETLPQLLDSRVVIAERGEAKSFPEFIELSLSAIKGNVKEFKALFTGQIKVAVEVAQ